MEAARKKTAELGEHHATLSEGLGKAWTFIENQAVTAMAAINKALGEQLNLMKQWEDEANRLGIAFGNIKPPKAPEAPAQFARPANVFAGLSGSTERQAPQGMSEADEKKIEAVLNARKEALDKASKATADHTKAVNDLVKAYSGQDAIAKAALQAEALAKVEASGLPVSKMARDT
jgi:hypothetical protein